ncbi:hypothetical protein JQ604_40925 [Bradyrhizobium jicamae]|uniref:hypothetical protein n=1 Tax=Bradyrhizobium jicamae TaxID=280332 RepID=UPI001BA5346C|nr:hypothetical protein [Bradyrhizobium jicamae]MBR0758584.1 hypothetical protein [Bradyrhizobium jicamae]
MSTADKTIPRALAEIELDVICGGKDDLAAVKAEAQLFQLLSSTISDVLKNFGSALQTAARAG